MRSLMTLATLTLVAAVAVAAHAESALHEEHTFSARPGQTLVIDVSIHRVEVTVEPGDTVHVVVDLSAGSSSRKTARMLDDLRPVFEDRGETLLVRSACKSGWGWFSGSIQGEVVVTMPPGLNLKISSSSGSTIIDGDLGDADVVCDASSGSVTVRGAMRELAIDTSSGSIRAEVSRPLDRFSADASSGSVQLDGGARTAVAETSSGSITLLGLLGDARMSASSGGITAAWDSIPADATISASASSGNVQIELPPGTELSGTASTSSGSMRTDFAGTYDDDEIEFRGGPEAVKVRIDTSSGNVAVVAD